jgi:hypothetical protein
MTLDFKQLSKKTFVDLKDESKWFTDLNLSVSMYFLLQKKINFQRFQALCCNILKVLNNLINS